MSAVQRRTRIFVALSTLVVVGVVACGALLVKDGIDTLASDNAKVRARSAVALLVTVGAKLPDLTRTRVENGLTPVESRSLDRALRHGQDAGLLAGLEVRDETGRIVYSPDRSLEGTRPPAAPEVLGALAGERITQVHETAFDPTTGRHSGLLDAVEPLRDDEGRIYGTIETSIPLAPIVADTDRIRERLILGLIGGVLIVWLVALPIVIRTVRAATAGWIPGRRQTLTAFARALERGEIEMAYQPQIDPASGQVEAVEALVRWREHGTLRPPDTFLPAVESSSLMPRLTDRALELALAQLASCDEAGHAIRMSVNCSANDLADPAFPERIAAALERAGIPGDRLTLELTETAILQDPIVAGELLASISALGVDIAIDDFGTGHASIARLHGLPVDEVKIDRSFMTTDAHSRRYVTAIISFARSLGLRIVAEGVEDQETLVLLRAQGCDLAQGFHISRPVAGADLMTLLDESAAGRVAWAPDANGRRTSSPRFQPADPAQAQAPR